MDLIGLGLKVYRRRDDIARVYALLAPAWKALQPTINELVPLLKGLLIDFAPQLAAAMEARSLTYDVKTVQGKLREKGYRVALDGDYGDQTRSAIRQFQRDHHLTIDGWAGFETLSVLFADD